MNDNKFFIINEDGIRVDARALSKFKLASGNDYIAYTYDEINADGMIKIYVTGMSFINNEYIYREITTDQEWNDIKTILKTLAKSAEEPFPEAIKSDLKIVGEEVSIRKPRKLLVSKKFADVLATKYIEVATAPVVEEVPAPVVEEPVIPVPTAAPEVELEKTIKIPTFEELQARNKSIEAAMETAKEEVPTMSKSYGGHRTYEDITPKTPVYESRVKKVDYEEQFKKDVEPVLLDVYAKQQKHIEELEEELSKTKFDLFEKQKEALSLSNENEQIQRRSQALEEELDGVQKKMNGILSVLQDK